MESHLGVPLFDRVGRSLRLNEKGRLLASRLAPLYRQLNDSIHLVVSDTMVGDVHLGASTTLADYVLPQILYDFKKQHELVNIVFESASTQEVVRRVESGELDMGFVEGVVHNPRVRTTVLREENLVVVTSDRTLAESGPCQLEDLMDRNWLIRQGGSGTRETFLQQVMCRGLSPNIFLELSNNEAIKTVLHNPKTLTCISRLVVDTELRHKEFFIVPMANATFPRLLMRILHRDRSPSPVLESVTDAVMDTLTQVLPASR
jgi:DNA-binding transcriptional LysR family regulator